MSSIRPASIAASGVGALEVVREGAGPCGHVDRMHPQAAGDQPHLARAVVARELFGGDRESQAAQGGQADALDRVVQAGDLAAIGVQGEGIGHPDDLGGEQRLGLHRAGDLCERGIRGVGELLDAQREVEDGGKARHALAQFLLDLLCEGLELGVE